MSDSENEGSILDSLTVSQLKQARRAVTALVKHASKSEDEEGEIINLVITAKKPVTNKTNYIPRIIPLPHKLASPKTAQILFITKDPVSKYREELENPKSITKDLFTTIMSVKKLKSMSRNKKSLQDLFSSIDYIMVDHRTHHLMPEILGKKFYHGHRKIPFMVRISKPTKSELEGLRINQKVKELMDIVDSKYISAQVKKIIKSTYFFLTTGTCFSIKIGKTSMKIEDIMDNAFAVLDFFTNVDHEPIGGGSLKHGLDDIQTLQIKTPQSISLSLLDDDVEKKRKIELPTVPDKKRRRR